jgi:hypothetical protein
MAVKPAKILKVLARIFLIVLISVAGLLVLISLLLLIPAVQNRIAQFALSKVETMVDTEISLEAIRIVFPNQVTLKNLYAADMNADTLISAGRIKVDINLLDLPRNKIRVRNLELGNTVVKLELFQKDSLFNFNPYIEAFSADQPEEAKPEDTTGNGFSLTVDRIALNNVKVSYRDHIGDNHYRASIGDFELELHSMDLEKNNFQVYEITLSESTAHMVINSVAEPDDEEEKGTFNIGLQHKIELNGVDFTMENNVTRNEISVHNVHFSATSNQLDLSDSIIDLEKVSLTDTRIAYRIMEKNLDELPQEQELTENGSPLSISWKISLNELILKDNEILLSDENNTTEGTGIDFSDLLISNVSATIKNTSISSNLIETTIENFSLTEKSGFEIEQFSVALQVTDTRAQMDNLLLVTPHSQFQNSSVFNYTSINQLQENPYDVGFETEISNSHIEVADLLYFQPSLSSVTPLFSNPGTEIFFDASINGTAGDMTLDHFRTGFASTRLATSGNIKGLPNMTEAYFDLSIDKLSTTGRDISMILPDTLLPDQVNLPPALNLTGNFEGSAIYFHQTLIFGQTSAVFRHLLKLKKIPHRINVI